MAEQKSAERIQEFERRIQLLLEEEDLPHIVQNANVHQLVAMKAFVLELDGKLQSIIDQNKHLQKRNSYYKNKCQDISVENKEISVKFNTMVESYKGKISGYEALILKLTNEL